MSTLTRFLAAIALSLTLAYGGHHYWSGQYGGNFNPSASLDTTQVIDGTPHGLHTV